MKPREFEELALDYWAQIPDDYKAGVDGVRVVRRAQPHPDMPDVYTLGECVTEAYPSDYGGPDTIRSAVVLYWGSFAALSRLDPEFDWEDELWETLTHELRHHLESLAAEDALEAVDYAADENFKRAEGEPFDPFFHHSGEPVPRPESPRLMLEAAPGVVLPGWRVEGEWFFELEYEAAASPAGPAALEWLGARHAFELPQPSADVVFAMLGGGFDPYAGRTDDDRDADAAVTGGRSAGREKGAAAVRVDAATLVLVRRVSAWQSLVGTLRGRRRTVDELELSVTTERLETGGGR